MSAHRSLEAIARDIRIDWIVAQAGRTKATAAMPYLSAMGRLDKLTDSYGADNAASIVRYFLANASQWRGETARTIKKELNDMLKVHDKAK